MARNIPCWQQPACIPVLPAIVSYCERGVGQPVGEWCQESPSMTGIVCRPGGPMWNQGPPCLTRFRALQREGGCRRTPSLIPNLSVNCRATSPTSRPTTGAQQFPAKSTPKPLVVWMANCVVSPRHNGIVVIDNWSSVCFYMLHSVRSSPHGLSSVQMRLGGPRILKLKRSRKKLQRYSILALSDSAARRGCSKHSTFVHNRRQSHSGHAKSGWPKRHSQHPF